MEQRCRCERRSILGSMEPSAIGRIVSSSREGVEENNRCLPVRIMCTMVLSSARRPDTFHDFAGIVYPDLHHFGSVR